MDGPGITELVFKKPPKCKSNNTGNSNIPKRSLKVFPSNEKVKVLNLIRRGKNNHMLTLLKSTVRMTLLAMKLPNL